MLRGLHPNAVASGRDLARRFDFSACRSMIDVGGGSGGLIAALCEANPALHAALFDLPRMQRWRRQFSPPHPGASASLSKRGIFWWHRPVGRMT